MKKEDLRETLDRIRPSEELINATMQKIKEQQEVQQRTKVPFWSMMNYRWVSPVVACALILCVGMVAWGQTGRNAAQDGASDVQEYRLAEEIGLHSDAEVAGGEPTTGEEAAMAEGQQLAEEQDVSPVQYEQWVTLQGTVLACRFLEVTQEVADSGIASHAIVEVSVQEILEQHMVQDIEQDSFSQESISIYAGFTDGEKLNELVNSMGSEIRIQIVPEVYDNEVSWRVTDFG